jgi:hypothetical protein
MECSGYEFESDCRMHVTGSGKKCYWNVFDDPEGTAGCVDFEDVDSCDNICTNDASGIGSYICDGNIVQKNSVKEICRWEQKGWENVSRNCNCEGDEILENCTLIVVKSPSDCNSALSTKGNCFYNGDFDKELGMFLCADVGDITECEHILNNAICIYARKHTFENLDSNSSVSHTVFLCLWDVENEICKSKKLGTVDIIPESRSSFIFIIIFVVIGVCAVFMSVSVIVVIIIKMRKKVNNRTKEFEMNNKLLRAASLKLSENSLPSSGLMKMLFVYRFLLTFFFHVDTQ